VHAAIASSATHTFRADRGQLCNCITGSVPGKVIPVRLKTLRRDKSPHAPRSGAANP
jgi:hypothetical protein